MPIKDVKACSVAYFATVRQVLASSSMLLQGLPRMPAAGHVMVPGVRHQQSHARAGVKLPACGWPSLSTGSTSSQQVARGSRTLTFAKRRKKATGAQMLTRQVLSVPACMLQLIAVDWLMTVKVHTHYIYSVYV